MLDDTDLYLGLLYLFFLFDIIVQYCINFIECPTNLLGYK
jgi:hypothetical protein